ncbi:MAG: nucleoside triphosphate pyrophosphohydrolase [Rhodobacteraceae bacterium]|uniref:Nucleoside triphosphate pyrophosphohydrolase n=1 Tax=Thioclava marina TaxID=1915077 RepID=A0ABX3MQG4_9RHOB|nr:MULTISPECIES: nucleoside triphosphate pyrophosphohydrolase [Thioclava]OOY12469.1 nucleoside triphosphate pyrophosphohydrolase [Thioclava marina]OOY28418.1 nucleoside triphosphate pyrophosphohydrolase [Thioclava sp. L04-15]TNE94560.1 MAG: nucleoside triphosphate pyrophosphohydrolase [Paracoccaceae bacterium]TNF12655.1 MAG: nucleoside triphosphate pyrophosphohydrolase [Paracoccaceae bacterium]
MAKPDDALIFDESGEAAHQFDRLIAIMACLRDPKTGCPWDLEQDFASIAPYTIEEAHEVADAIARQAWEELPGELGDLALQVVYHAQMASEEGRFDIADVLRAINAKMVARHPHVFGNESRDKSAAQQTADWEKIKAAERAAAGKTERVGVLDGVALGLPALTRAIKLQNRAARVGFDWPSTDEVLEKIVEEARELEEARDQLGPEELAEEYGDLLFVMVNLGRHLELDPEGALRAANLKFTNRFNYIERELEARGKAPKDSDLDEMDALWNAAKARGIK